jgi:hypothetical protein
VKFFVVAINQLNLRPFGSLKLLVENSLKICGFFIFFSNKGKIFYVFKEKINTKRREKDFIVEHCIIFSIFF